MATREQVQKALQRPQARGEGEETTPVRKKEEVARSRGAMPSSFAKSTKTNEQTKVKIRVPPEVPHDTRICIEDLVDTDVDEPDVDKYNSRQKSKLSEADFTRDELHRALKSALETQVLMCSDEWLCVFSDYVGRLGNEPPGARAQVALTGPTEAEYLRGAEEAETKAAATIAVASNAKSRTSFERFRPYRQERRGQGHR